MKRTYIKIKRGILEKKHYDKLGNAWRMYFYMLDLVNWESGTINDWKDKYAADELDLPLGLVREHRERLEREGYITCEKGQHSQTVIIHNYTNPKTYDGEVLNINTETAEDYVLDRIQSKEKSLLSNSQSSEKQLLSKVQSNGQSSGQTTFNHAENSHSSYSHIKHINKLNINKDDVNARTVPPSSFLSSDTIDRLFAYGMAKSVIREFNANPQGWTDAAVNRCIDDLRERKGDDIGGLLTVTFRQPAIKKYLARAIDDRSKYAISEYAELVNH